eukprot:jgi/Phyca11/128651/e_gw1.77.88.1
MERKQFSAAVPYFTEALEALTSSSSDLCNASSTVKLYHQRGLCYLGSKKYKAAIEDLSRVMHMTPKSAELYAKRGKAYAALGEHHAAMLDYNEAINLAATQGLLHDCIESRRLEKRALEDYSRALELAPNNVETLRLRGEAHMHLARYDDALADFAQALEVDPHDFQVSMARAKLFRQRGDLKGAVDEVTKVLQVSGFFINGLKLRAQLYEELGEIKEAEKDYSSII